VHRHALLAAALALVAAWLAPAYADEIADDDAGAVIEEVLVTGVQPGPGLWRVARPTDDGAHVLWVMGQYGPLPTQMEWRSTEIEAAIAGSQELLAEPEVDAEMGPFAGLGALPSLVGVRNNPDGRRLEELMSIQLYARWVALKAEYLGYDQDVESDLGLMRARANAWAIGDIAALRAMTNLNQAGACITAIMNAQVLRERGLTELPERLMAAWLAEAERALMSNASTVAVLPMRDVLRPDGYLARLRESGYVVDEPPQ